VEERATTAELRQRLESVALQVIERQLTTVADVGSVERGDTLTSKVKDLQAHVMFGVRALPNPAINPGEGTQRLCLTVQLPDQPRRYRQFTLEIIGYEERTRELLVRLYVSRLLTEAECKDTNGELNERREVDTNFKVGLFDFPMIDNTRLSGSERAAVSVTALTPDVVSVAVSYFPASRASLKDKPYIDEVNRLLVGSNNK
jgi:hypothetical protein